MNFISIKWIFLIILYISSVSFAFDLGNGKKLKPINPRDYISDFEDYGNRFFKSQLNKKEESILKKETSPLKNSIQNSSKILQSRFKLDKNKSDRLATLVILASKKYKLDPRIMLAIMKVESDFNQKAHNSYSCKRSINKDKCGDHSIAQINYNIWKVEFKNRGRKPLDFDRLKSDDAYAIFRMAEILSIIKQENKKDPIWFAIYHSKTQTKEKDLKTPYANKVKKEFAKIKDLTPSFLPIESESSLVSLN